LQHRVRLAAGSWQMVHESATPTATAAKQEVHSAPSSAVNHCMQLQSFIV
jgi:hypothetical protein